MFNHRFKMTVAAINKVLSTPERPQILRDTDVPGLLLRLNRSSNVWYLSYKPIGRRPDGSRMPTQSFRIGTWTSHSLAEARRVAAKLKVEIAQGTDPAAEQRRTRTLADAARVLATTLGEDVERYIKNNLTGSEHHIGSEASSLRLGLREMKVGSLSPEDLQPRHVQQMLDLYRGRACARHRFGAWSRFCEHLVGLGKLETNPCDKIPKKNRPKPPAARQRVYRADEICALAKAARRLDAPYDSFLMAAIHLPMRLGELSNLRVRDVDLVRGCVSLAGKMTKNGDPFSMPLSQTASGIFENALDGNVNDRVFPLAPGGGEFKGQTKYKRRIKDLSGVADFNFHPLRRTFVTTLAELGIGDPMVADALLNHRQSQTRGGVIGVYNQAKLWPQKVRMMNAWSALVNDAIQHGEWTGPEHEGVVASLTNRQQRH